IKKGYRIAVITGGRSKNVEKRLRGLGITDIFTGISDKKDKLEDYLQMNLLEKENVLYMGDDLPDYEALQMSGLPSCPTNAAKEIKAICTYISPLRGGHGCVRDVIEKVLKLNGDWD